MSVRAERVVRERVMNRDGYRCKRKIDGVECGAPATDAGHIVARSQGGTYTENNLQAECTTHNRSEGYAFAHPETPSAETADEDSRNGRSKMSSTAPEVTPAETAAQTTPPATTTETTQPDGGKPESKADTVDWKAKARDWEQRAKANKDKADRFDQLEESQKTEQQKAAEAAERSKQEAAEARAETARWKAAATHHVSEEYFDLLGTGTPEEISARAERVGKLEAAAKELAALKAGQADAAMQQTAQPGKQPVPQLKPGSPQVPDSSYPTDWFPQLRPVDTTNQQQ